MTPLSFFGATPSTSFPVSEQQSLRALTRGKDSFLDDMNFDYKDEIYKYFHGRDDLPLSDRKEFLSVLEEVLEATETLGNDEVKEVVRSKFLELYWLNHEMLIDEESPVHRVFSSVDFQIGGEFPGLEVFDPMIADVQNYLEGRPSKVIKKYIRLLGPTDIVDNADEFYQVYVAVIKLCSRNKNLPLFSASTKKDNIRAHFDDLYSDDYYALNTAWGSKRSRELECLLGSVVPSSGNLFQRLR
ncbi:MAG: hypothetical protein KFB93_00005 [Simkaniaceae bacterium]|nr:MAG: hypothetical protein KFB93_00005 [Simkaniaceae bacterium]